MMRWFARWLYKQLRAEQIRDSPEVALIERDVDGPPKTKFAIREAINGRFIEISSYKPNQRGSDWVTEYFIVPEGKKVSEALTMLMLMKGLDE